MIIQMISYLGIAYIIVWVAIFVITYITNRIFGNSPNQKISRISPLRYMVNDSKTLIDYIYYYSIILFLELSIIFVIFILNNIYFNSTVAVINVVDVEGIVIGFFAVAISTMTFIITLAPKEYYLFFTKNDVLNKYHIGKVYFRISIYTFLSVICTILLINDSDIQNQARLLLISSYEYLLILIVVLGIYSLIIVGKISFGNNKFELKMIHELYTIFWDNSKKILPNDIDKNALEVNLAYLLFRYENIIKKYRIIFDIKSIKSIYYKIIENNTKYTNFSIKITCCLGGVMVFFSAIASIYSKSFNILYINIFSFLISVIIIKVKPVKKYFGNYILKLWLDKKGYIVVLDNRKVKFIGSVSIWHNHFLEKYIHEIKNIMAFYYVAVDSKIEKKDIEVLYSESIDFLKLNDFQYIDKWDKCLYYMPILIGGYYYYSKYGDIPHSIEDFLGQMKFTDREKKKIRTTIKAFIRETSRYRICSGEIKVDNYKFIKLEEYLEKLFYQSKEKCFSI